GILREAFCSWPAREKNSTHLAERESTFLSTAIERVPASMNDQLGERIHVSLQEDQHPDQARQGNAVPEDVSQNATLVSVPFRSGPPNEHPLRTDHFPHYPATAVCGRHEDRRNADLSRRNLLQAPEQDV